MNERSSTATEKIAYVSLGVLIAYAIVRSLFAAASKPLWYDELLTLIVARQSSPSMIWSALAHGVDGQPPPFFFIEHAAGTFLPRAEISFRLPTILAFACVLLCVFGFVRRRSGPVYALVCAAMLLDTALYYPYATEARPYELLVACIALALVCYQRAPETRWVVLMGMSLLAAETMHYYAVFAFVPLGIAEVALSLKMHRLRAGVWLALACGILPLAIFWPLLRQLKQMYGAHVWAHPTLRRAIASYPWLVHMPQHDHWQPAFAAMVVLVLLGTLAALAFRNVRTVLLADPFFHEYALIWALLGLPFVVFAGTRLAHGGMDQRYFLSAALAFPLAAGYILPRLNRGITVLLAVLIVCMFALQETRFWNTQRGHLGRVVSPADSVERVVSAAGHPELPVVVSNGFDYLQMAYYAPPEWAGRFVETVDPAKAVAYIGTDSVDKDQLAARSFYPLQVYEFQDFAADHPSFLLYLSGDADEWEWWPRALRDDGYSLQVIAADGRRKIYLVTRNGTSP